MQGRNWILVGIAVILGLAAVLVANAWFSGVEQRQAQVAEQQQMARIVVANQPIAFGNALSVQNVKLVNWPQTSVPVGAFNSIDEALKGGSVALRPIVVGEPVLASKLSGRATLSANLPVGFVAYAIPISEVAGVAGFVRPGDIVDVLLTRQIPGDNAGAQDKMNDVVLTAIPVLAIDTVADDTQTEAKPGKTATLQVDRLGAQKLALSSQLGSLSLALRNAADQTLATNQTVLPPQLSGRNIAIRKPGNAAPPMAPLSFVGLGAAPVGPVAAPRPMGPTMTVVRGSQSSEYEVPRGH